MIDTDAIHATAPRARDPVRTALLQSAVIALVGIPPCDRLKAQTNLDRAYRSGLRARWPTLSGDELDASSHRLWRDALRALQRIEGAAPQAPAADTGDVEQSVKRSSEHSEPQASHAETAESPVNTTLEVQP